MRNTVTVEKPIRNKLKMATLLLAIFSVMFIVFLVCVCEIDKKSLNGRVEEVTGTLTSVFEKESNVITLNGKDDYNVMWDLENGLDLKQFVGREITLITSQTTFGGSNPWVFGLTVENKVLVDYTATLKQKTKENAEIKKVLIAVTVITCVATCAVAVWRFNVTPTEERVLYHEFAEFVCMRQPPCPQRKIFNRFVYAFAAIILVCAIPPIVLDSQSGDEITPLTLAFLIVEIALLVLGIAATFALRAWVIKCERKFYANNFPFDFSDISHIVMRKKIKEKLQAEIVKAYAENPDLYPDGGNGYDALFTQSGIVLKRPQEENDVFEAPDANEVFASPNALQTEETLPKDAVMKLTYDELKLEAVAHFRKAARPLTVIVKSSLDERTDLPEEFENDLHFALDSNLLKTLRKFNVEVANLDYVLENAAELIEYNCKAFKRR